MDYLPPPKGSPSDTPGEAMIDSPSMNKLLEPHQDVGKLELGSSWASINSASHGVSPPLLKHDLPTICSRWSPGHLIAKFRVKKFTWKHYVFFTFIMLLPVVIITVSVLLTRGRAEANPTIDVDLGYTKYEGYQMSNGINQWLGMRYAAPPLGELRFKAPQDPPNSTTIQPAHKHGALCHFTPSTSLDPTTSEDCLFIDVSAPANTNSLHPVYFFIQGGGFNTLSNSNPVATSLIDAANHDVVVVSFNYRVGPWGFLASKEVMAGGNLNVGLLDQRKALEWVQKYIHLFGGDPKHVTIDGDSAGAASVDLHLTAYGGRDDGLFHAAVGESNSFGAQLTVEESQYQYDGLVERTGCGKANDTLKCLRELDVAVIAKNNINMPTPGAKGLPVFMYSNVVEGPGGFTEDYTYSMYGAGNFVKVPVIFGSVSNEGTIFTPPATNTLEDMNDFLKNNWVKLTKAQLDQIDSYYPLDTTKYPNKGAYWRTAASAYGEIRYNCPGIYMNEMFQNHTNGASNWNYHWDVLTTANNQSGYGVTHTAEISSIWGSSTGQEAALIPTIQGYWTSFIRTKNPNTYRLAGTPEWTTFGTSMSRIHFPDNPKDVNMETVDPGQHARCQYYLVIANVIGN